MKAAFGTWVNLVTTRGSRELSCWSRKFRIIGMKAHKTIIISLQFLERYQLAFESSNQREYSCVYFFFLHFLPFLVKIGLGHNLHIF